MFTDDSGKMYLKTVVVHKHEPCPDLSKQLQISNSAKRKVSETLLEPPAKLIRSEMTSASDFSADNVTRDDVQGIRRNVNYANRKNLLPLPKCADDIHKALDTIDKDPHT